MVKVEFLGRAEGSKKDQIIQADLVTRGELEEFIKELKPETPSANPVNGEPQPDPDPVVYKCKGRDCRFSSDDISELMLHTIEAHIPKSEPIKEEPKKMHHTAKEFLECPECFPAFEKEFLGRGYVKKVESPKEEESLLP